MADADASADDENCIYQGDWLTVRAMARANGSRPGKEWADSLDKKGMGQLLASCAILETTLRVNRPPAGRAEKIGLSVHGLWELRVTKPGSTPPHLRLMYLRRGQTIWVAEGFTKQKNRLTSTDIGASDAVASEWLEGEGKVK